MLPDLTLVVKSGQVSWLCPTPRGQDRVCAASSETPAILASRIELTRARWFSISRPFSKLDKPGNSAETVASERAPQKVRMSPAGQGSPPNRSALSPR